MKYDNDFLATLYGCNDLDTFLSLVDLEKVDDPRTRAILFTLQQSIQSLKLEFSTVQINELSNTEQKSNAPQET